MNKPLGCLSRSGLLAALLALVLLAGAGLIWGGLLFNPGPLNAQGSGQTLGGVRSHAETGGRCSACHPAFWSKETMADRCVLCHTDIATQLRDPTSLHGVVMSSSENQPCYNCHPEHRGSDAQLTTLDPDAFPHQATGYSLEGHELAADDSPFACTDCHAENLASLDPIRCADCHRDLDAAYMQAHDRAFGPDCLACHDGLDTYGAPFDHGQSAFPLLGRHALLACADCHQRAQAIADLKGTPQDCFACHQADDAHDGQFGPDCAACHTAAGWEQAIFDHGQTAFPLAGLHVEVACQDCHLDNVYRGTPQDCFACHQADDAHDGQFGRDCAACHTTDGWEQATFDHNQTAFPLSGAHLETACALCHLDGVYQGTPQDCAVCHEDPAFHRGLLGSECASCHTATAWSPARYDRAHSFPTNHGEDGANPCQTCHPETLSTYTCYDCHEHDRVETEGKHREEGITNFQDCMRCHPTGQEDESEGEED